MKIIDLTHHFTNEKNINNHHFNNSVIHYKDNLYIVIYRIIRNKSIEYIHPWKIWWDSYRRSLRNTELHKKNNHLGVNIKLFDELKYRNHIAYDKFVIIPKSINEDLIDNDFENYDSTGLAIFEMIDNKWNIYKNINNLFGDELNHDTRITKINDDFYITYNMFHKTDEIMTVRMMQRKIKINLDNNYIYLSKENDMLENFTLVKSVEKNCILDLKEKILYNINGEFIVYDKNNNNVITNRVNIIDEIINYYGKENIIFSLGTPCIKYKNKQLSVGHIKFQFKKKYNDYSPLKMFIDGIDFSKIYQHGKYIYMMFLFEFDDNYNVTRISNSFIPTDENECHLPYHVVFPTGLCINNDNVLISYGEGDTRCKLIVLHDNQIESLLYNIETLSIDTYNFHFLSSCFFNNSKILYKNILHIGYFNEFNCGDDAFVKVFQYLQHKYYPHYNCHFTKNINNLTNKKMYNLITIGGGDIINEYFLDNIKKEDNVIAIGVGIPYESNIDMMHIFKSIYLRYSGDLNNVRNKLNNTVNTIETYPDLVFLFDRIYGNGKKIIKNNNFKIGFCLTRTYYNINYEDEYISFVINIVNIIKNLLEKNYEIYLIPFGINETKLKENDNLLNSHIKSFFKNNNNVIDTYNCYNYSYDKDNYVEYTYNLISSMNFIVCSRFHAHIYSTILRKPFVSLSCSRKCKNYMIENDLSSNYYELETNDILIPININSNEITNFIIEKINNKNTFINKLENTMISINKRMDIFIEKWLEIIFTQL